MDIDICVVGGLGKIGFPLSVVFANAGFNVVIADIDKRKYDMLKEGTFEFEYGLKEIFDRIKGRIMYVTDDNLPLAKFYIICLGTEVDECGQPSLNLINFIKKHSSLLKQCNVIVRSTLYLGASKTIEEILGESIAYCPERIAEGRFVVEYESFPQIIGCDNIDLRTRVNDLFKRISGMTLFASLEEAECTKLFCNAYRYINFSIANEMFMHCSILGINFNAVHQLMTFQYPRAQGLPKQGFASGYCLRKDTVQSKLLLGSTANIVNDDLITYVCSQVEDECVGILGMSFKPDSSDLRDSHSLMIRKQLLLYGHDVECYDPFVLGYDSDFNKARVLHSPTIIIGTPHTQFSDTIYPLLSTQKIIDIWGAV